MERSPQNSAAPKIDEFSKKTGFPKPAKIDFSVKRSRFRAAANQPKLKIEKREEITEAQRIHEQNMEKISSMTLEEVSAEKAELLASLDPKLLQSLLKRTEARAGSHDSHEHAEGHDGWIGGGRNGRSLPKLDDSDVKKALGGKAVLFAEEDDEVFIEDSFDEPAYPNSEDDEVAPEGYQILPEPDSSDSIDVHFPKPKPITEDPEMSMYDPKFYDQLHEKYFPDLPKETSKLAWMTTPMPKRKFNAYESISDMRFDFKGNLIKLDDKSQDVPTYIGLHHHSDNPQLAGYTIPELAHFSRSVVPTQRCLGIQVLGRILHKLGLHKYNIVPLSVDEDEESPGYAAEMKEVLDQFEDMMWNLLYQVRAIDSITEASDETKTKNLSVRNYALEALWLWKKSGGRLWTPSRSEEEVIAENLYKEAFDN